MSTSTVAKFGETEFTELIRAELSKAFTSYKVDKDVCLLYKLHFDAEGNLQPTNYRSPTRGQLAFETDILIRDSIVPLVVLEIKFGRFTTHDVLTYSTKASKHKDLYPYLRYGLVVGGLKKIEHRFFTHNSDFDFAFTFSDPTPGIPRLIEIVGRQIKIAEKIGRLDDSEVSSFETLIEFS
jgi:hypothetical protein